MAQHDYYQKVRDFINGDSDLEIVATMYGMPINDPPRSCDHLMTLRKCNTTPAFSCVDQIYGFVYVWGFPGPDYNTYMFQDYGKTWAFTREEIKNQDLLPD